MRFTLSGARLVDATMDVAEGNMTIAQGTIQTVNQADSQPEVVIDATDAIILPGFIDVHTHGGGGHNLHTTKLEEILAYNRWVASTGVTSYLVTVVGTPNCMPEAQLQTAVSAIKDWQHRSEGAQPLGIFLEGPYINEKKRGAHPPIWLRRPSLEETERVLELTEGYLKLVTLAPELVGANEMMARLLAEGVTISMGHTEASYEQTLEAVKHGVSHVTHCFNAMQPLHHRNPGPLAAIAPLEHVMGELIADGVHVHPSMMYVLVKLLGPQRTIVITDAQAGAGVPDSTFEFAGQVARAICGAARLEDGTLAGSILTLDQGLRNILEMTPVNLQEASGMLSYNAARSIKVADHKGLLRPGYDADFVILNQALELQATVRQGRVIYNQPAWEERLALLKQQEEAL
ncbi:N-acetylglucosamine-6-phosphate deacetylase [Ktedonobacter sp. SOSP1-52]|uniref:N-acetylglucosamine-6-phosphate deacetylase n=1 Tax=Ktedonobacter sp. SOSP1-52 TaxID=2778366 RepID=UPI0019152D3B|nr:N-acetylglucosamine-6-phosphate deacetylase [Ktedonobacter sp. SOSP1-52]GHO66079.1 N-acetylglucosamine-6-phosphate deacetylase [Ktedonobacter sp. SOSP1-52]